MNYNFVCFDFYIGVHHCKAINFLTDFLIFNKIKFALDWSMYSITNANSCNVDYNGNVWLMDGLYISKRTVFDSYHLGHHRTDFG